MKNTNIIHIKGVRDNENKVAGLPLYNNLVNNNDDIHGECVSDHNTLEKQEFDYKYTVQNGLMTQLGLRVNLFSTIPMSESYRARAELEVQDAVKFFHDKFPLADSKSVKDINMFVFENSDQFRNKTDAYHVHLNPLAGGIAWHEGHHGQQAYTSYVFKSGSSILNLQHEIAHILTWEATDQSYLNSILLEGISEYIQNAKSGKYDVNEDDNGIVRFDTMEKIDSIVNILHERHNLKVLDLDAIMDVISSESSKANSLKDNITLHEYNGLKYDLGYVLVKFMQDRHPSELGEYFASLKKHGYYDFDIKNYSEEFNHWMKDNITKGFFEKYNILKVEKGDFIGTGNVIINNEVQNIKYFDANIKDYLGNDVGSFSPVKVYSIGSTLRIENANTYDTMNIREEYHFIKLAQFDGKNKYVCCDEQGNLYTESLDYKISIGRIISKYDSEFKKEFDIFRKVQRSDNVDEVKAADMEYIKAVDKKISNILHCENDSDANLRKILVNFTYIDTHQIRGANGIDIDLLISRNPDEIFSMKSDGDGNISAVSIYMNDNKVGEILTECGTFAQYVLSNNNEITQFQAYDITHSISISKFDQVAIAVTMDQYGKKELSILDNSKIGSDKVVFIEANKFFKPDIRNINDVNNLIVSKNVKIDDYEDRANYRDSEKYLIRKGDIADNKGTDRTDDDTHFAQVTKGDEVLVKLKSIGFYISEEMVDENGMIDQSALFIHDHVAGKFFQLPGSVTHLKLVTINNERVLVPSTSDGNENPKGMPVDIGNYRYIDPIFAHEYVKEDYSHEHVNIGLINFDKYVDGTLFKVQYDVDDYSIMRNDAGEIIRNVPYQKYYTKVKLLHDDREIGMLSNRFDKFEGDVMISADLNYSYTDFLASVHYQEVDLHKDDDGIVTLRFVGETGHEDTGYSNYSSARHRIDKNTDGYQHMEENNAYMQEKQRKANEEAYREKKLNDYKQDANIQDSVQQKTDNSGVSDQQSGTALQVSSQSTYQDGKTNSENEYQKSLSFSITPKHTTDSDGNVVNTLIFFIIDKVAGKFYQLPDAITHMKLTTISDGQKRLVLCTSDGEENPEGMPVDIGNYKYIDSTFVHSYETAQDVTLLDVGLANLNKYNDGVLFRIHSDDQYPAKVQLLHDTDGKIGVLPFHLDRFQNIRVKPYEGASAIENKKMTSDTVGHNGYNDNLLIDNHRFSYNFDNKDHNVMHENQLLAQQAVSNLHVQQDSNVNPNYEYSYIGIMPEIKSSNDFSDLII
ncbi:hypothetical protein [Candidatus Neoehrlichia procyonis]|uniref:Surface domain protein n=1 Tax=Candidatus Neoehrlichia procyonis str. RAC413 TaxID=1359163 RepID=A0A0F3NNA0_9RICK|nr:hypothetical protein [Candidatus Neoehrlichia lotoris]KJV69236.1 surface domain protein [Candidatus Neoehrlichia lotoris str. RAC413]